MTETDVKKALVDHVPKKLAAKVREYLPLIQQKINAGVTITEILEILKKNGMEVKRNTLNSYLYRFRKEQEASLGKSTKQPDQAAASAGLDSGGGDESPTESSDGTTGTGVSETALHKLMNPDPAKQADQLEQYARAAKTNRKKQK